MERLRGVRGGVGVVWGEALGLGSWWLGREGGRWFVLIGWPVLLLLWIVVRLGGRVRVGALILWEVLGLGIGGFAGGEYLGCLCSQRHE